MNINNLFDFSSKSLKCNNQILYITEHAFYISILSINDITHKYNYYADEWLYLINYNYPNSGYYNFFVNNYNNIIAQINDNDIIFYNKNVISMINTFCKGSVHGYSSFWYTLITYLNNIEKYNNV